ncbi:hypothetical protein ACFP3I_11430 [Chryseobacterium arachidis]|uniref:hypothetical protein n=1 Tax=Chryseobacterium arachidis TaxID=1416778 RepID=UPI003609E3E3
MVTEWYHQLDDIKIAIEQQLSNEIVNQKLGAYSQNRFILPLLLQNDEIISGHPKCAVLHQNLGRFLNIVTKTQEYSHVDSVSHPSGNITCAMCNDSLSTRNANFQVDYSPLLDLRKNVDALVQIINKDVGKVIKTL